MAAGAGRCNHDRTVGLVLVFTTLVGRLAQLDRGGGIMLLFCGSKKSLASGLPMALVLFPAARSG